MADQTPKIANHEFDQIAKAGETFLKAAHPAVAGGVGHAGGLIAHVQELIAAAQARDVTATLKAFRDILSHIIGDEPPAPMMAGAGLPAGIDWKALLRDLLMNILPLILR